MINKEQISPKLLRKALRFDHETGKLFRRSNGKEAFTTIGDTGYMRGSIFNYDCFAHRIIWAIIYNDFPKYQIDHINHDRSDNRLSNLRAVTHEENARNQKLFNTNTSGVCGVVFDRDRRKWRAQIRVDRKNKYLGLFNIKDDAVSARKDAEIKYRYHPNHGIDKGYLSS